MVPKEVKAEVGGAGSQDGGGSGGSKTGEKEVPPRGGGGGLAPSEASRRDLEDHLETLERTLAR